MRIKDLFKIPGREFFTCQWHFSMVYLLVNQADYNILQAILKLDKHLYIKRNQALFRFFFSLILIHLVFEPAFCQA
jgi:hypothetical protein